MTHRSSGLWLYLFCHTTSLTCLTPVLYQSQICPVQKSSSYSGTQKPQCYRMESLSFYTARHRCCWQKVEDTLGQWKWHVGSLPLHSQPLPVQSVAQES